MVSNYVPLLSDEQETLQRMIEGQSAYVEVVGWGYHSTPTITAGDKRVQVRFLMEFSKPVGVSMPVNYFKLRLKLRNGRTIFEDTKSVRYGEQSLNVTAGMQLDMVWDIALDKISTELQGQFLPGVKGKEVARVQNGKVVKSGEGD